MFRFKSIVLGAMLTTALGLTGCSEDAATSTDASRPAEVAWVLTSAPAGAQSVTEAKASAKEGDSIVVHARIGGRKEPFTVGSPVFTVMDLAIPSCADNPGDNCPVPWDYCCETPETISANAATVQIVDANGQPVPDDPTAHGLAPLDEVMIVGTVGPRPNDVVLTIRATGIYRATN